MDEFFATAASARCRWSARATRVEPDPDAIGEIAELLGQARRPVLVLGTDVWADGADEAALRLVEELGIPTITNGMGRGVIPGGHPLLVTKARGAALGGADLVVVVGTPLDFRLGYGVFGGKEEAPPRPASCTSPTRPARSPATPTSRARRPVTSRWSLDGLREAVAGLVRRPDWSSWVTELQDTVRAAAERDSALLDADGRPDPPGAHLRRAGPPARRRRDRDR